jgi:hypothetical protein
MNTNGCEDRWTITDPTRAISLRDYLAAHAPECIPSWFLKVHKPDLSFESAYFGDVAKATQECYFKWRFFFADQMLAERSKS